MFFEPVLFAHAAQQPRIRILHRTEITDLAQDKQGVTASAVDLDAGTRLSIECDYLVGCDGASSFVRKSIGSEFVGMPVLQYAQSFHIRAPQLRSMLPGKPAWAYFSLNPRRCSMTMAVDGRETWNIQNYSYPGETGLDHLDRDWVIRSILGVAPDFEYELLSREDWIARRLVASKFRERGVFICGDAARVWMPLGGFGMSAGIADAVNLAWKLAGVLHGWAVPEILDAYEAERQPITDQASRIISDIGYQVMMQRHELSPDVERLDAIGEAARAAGGQRAYALDVEQQCCGGLNFGYLYDPLRVNDQDASDMAAVARLVAAAPHGTSIDVHLLRGSEAKTVAVTVKQVTVNEKQAMKALARAFRRKRMLNEGRYASVSDIAAAEKIDRGCVGSVLRLTLLAPDIVEAILSGRSSDLGLSRLKEPFPVEWAAQKQMLFAAATRNTYSRFSESATKPSDGQQPF